MPLRVPAALLSVRVWLPSAMLPLPLTVWAVVPALVPEMSRVPSLVMPLDEARLVVPVTPRVAPLATLTAPGAV